jgi:hypothetical protein
VCFNPVHQVDMGGERNRMDFTWKLEAAGAGAGLEHYGLALAQTLGFPPALLEQATRWSSLLDVSCLKHPDGL